jgi:hypothetical protein
MKQGSFNWYLERSGSFVTTMAKALQAADGNNRERIRKVFPQMVAAIECNSWDEVPAGFEADRYNANPIN